MTDAVALAGQVARGERTPAELLEDTVTRVEERNPALNAVIHRLFEKADQAAHDPGLAGPFAGVPLLVKDAVCHTAGDPYHVGMRLLRERQWTEPEDTFLAKQFRRAGFLIVGRTNTPELATAFTTEPMAYGVTRNPWDGERSAGGSSGGSAAAVAAGMVAVAHGNDMGGSIRVPASECGVVGLKPSRGRTSLAPDFGEYWAMLTHEGVLTRTVRDTAAVLDAVSGSAPGDPSPAPPLQRPLRDHVGTEPERLRIGLHTVVPVQRTSADPECVAAVELTGRLLEQCGHEVFQAEVSALDDEEMGAHFVAVFTASVARDLDRWGRRLEMQIGPDDVEPRNWMLAEHGRGVSAADYIAAVEYLQRYTRRVVATWERDVDILVTPTIPIPPPRLGRLPRHPDLADVADLGQFTSPFNVTGQPAMSLPLHWTADGLPVGVQLVAAYGREDLLVQVAAQLETAAPWVARYDALG